MDINLFHVLGKPVVEELTADERRVIDGISDRLSNDPEFEKRLRKYLTQAHIDRADAAIRDAQEYKQSIENSFAK